MQKKNKILYSLIIVVCLMSFIYALTISDFNNYSTPENLTFTGNQNITRNITINRFANVTSATMNLSGYSDFSDYYFVNNLLNISFFIYDFSFSSNGYQLFVLRSDYTIYEFICTEAWNVSTCSQSGEDLLTGYFVKGFDFSSDGYVIFAANDNSNDFYEFICSEAWNLSTCSYSGVTLDFEDVYLNSIDISQDGFNFYASSSATSDGFYQYYCSEAWNLSTCSYSGNYLYLNNAFNIEWTNSGVYFYASHKGGSSLYQYYCSEAWNLSTCSYLTYYSLDREILRIFIGSNSPYLFVAYDDTEEYPTWAIWSYYSSYDFPYNSWLEIGNINSNYEWNYSEAYMINNKTSDFSSTLNIALNEGACDCTGCSLDGNNCTINFTFHSDTAGILEYSALNISYDLPSINLVNPTQGYTYGTNESLPLNFTKTNFTEVTCFYNVKNSTNDLIVSNTTIANCQNTTFNIPQGDGTFTLTIYMNNSNGLISQDSNTFSISINAPAINLVYPTNNSAFNNGNNIYFNFTATDTDNVDICILYGDFNGTWQQNETFTGIINDVQNYTILNLSERNMVWTIWCNDTLGNGDFATDNNTLIVDLTKPIVGIINITTTKGSQTISFNSNASDTNLDSCKYSIYNSIGSIDGISENVSISCNSNPHSATTTAYGTYTLRVYATDLAGNEDHYDLNFTTSASSGGTTSGGSTSSVTQAEDFEIVTENYLDSIDISLPKESTRPRTKTFLIINHGTEEITIKVSCDEEESEDFSICDYVEFENDTFTISPNENDPELGTFSVYTPENAEFGDEYYFNIIGSSTSGSATETDKLSIKAGVSILANLYKWKAFSDNENAKDYPVVLAAFVLSLVISAIIYGTFSITEKKKIGAFISIPSFLIIFLVFLAIL